MVLAVVSNFCYLVITSDNTQGGYVLLTVYLSVCLNGIMNKLWTCSDGIF